MVAAGDDGQLTAGSLPGETSIMARYMNHICVARVAIPQTTRLPEDVFASLERTGFIDELVYDKLQKLSIEPSEPISDSLFMRRVYLDLIGRLPSVQEAKAFLEQTDEEKRAVLVDALLQRPEYADHWAGYWADLLRPNPYRVGIKAVLNYDNWIRQQFRENVSYDDFARKLITAKGSTWQNGAATLYRDRRSPDEVATMVSQLFLGIRWSVPSATIIHSSVGARRTFINSPRTLPKSAEREPGSRLRSRVARKLCTRRRAATCDIRFRAR